MLLFASDLDNTLIFSYKKVTGDAICVEMKADKKLSFMDVQAYKMLQEIKEKVTFVPITTRSVEQYRRIDLFGGNNPKYALVANGGILLIDNEIDQSWYEETKKIISPDRAQLKKALDILQQDIHTTLEPRFIDESFVYTKTDDINSTVETLRNSLNLNNVYVNSIGAKIYVHPIALNKGASLKRFKKRIGAEYVVCAGDSLLDVPMLEIADAAIFPDYEQLTDVLEGHDNVFRVDEKGIGLTRQILCIVENIYGNSDGQS